MNTLRALCIFAALTLHLKHAVRWIATLATVFAVSVAGVSAQGSTALYEVKKQVIRIPMKDGVSLSGLLLRPANVPAGARFPALLTYSPYRVNYSGDDCGGKIRYFVERGYVGACVDIRGTGRSEGHAPPREYSQQELSDGEEVIAWLASQQWSSGSVGIVGISWSGFNGLRLAMRHPPALKAVISAASTEVLYNEDCHYTDGVLDINDDYNFGVDGDNSESPSPNFPIDEQTLRNRFDNPPWTLVWLRHQRDDAFWHESQEPLGSMQTPVLLIAGLLDGYRDTIPRWLTQVHSPVRALVGPWSHTWPNEGDPGPGIAWQELALRWWDQWLKGKDTGVMSEPKLTVYMRHWYPPDVTLRETPGTWRAEDSWPPRDQKIQALNLQADHTLKENTSAEAVHTLKYVPSTGAEAGSWWGDLTPDQRPVDAYSLVYDSVPLQIETAILGLPEVLLQASATAPLADWFVRLSDVAPDGEVTQITGGGLNGAQRESMNEPKDLEPGQVYSLRVPMRFTSWVFPVGHRIRVSVSNALWPFFWPTPYPMSTSLHLDAAMPSRVLLPTVPVAGPVPPLASQALPGPSGGIHRANNEPWHILRTLYDDPKPTIIEENAETPMPPGPDVRPRSLETRSASRRFEVQDDHPELASSTGHLDVKVRLPARELVWHSEWDVHSDRMNFYYLFKRELRENGKVIRQREWQETIPRDHQ